MARTISEEVRSFLSDMYSVEQQALAQLVSAPDMAGDPAFAEMLRRHHAETEEQARLVGERLEDAGGSRSGVKDAVMKLGGKGFLLFARSMPETPGRLAAHAYSYEAMEWAGYQMLERLAERAGDGETAAVARRIGAEERTMMERLEGVWDLAERASHRDTDAGEMAEHVRKHLAEAHALESQGEALTKRSIDMAGSAATAGQYRALLENAREQADLLEARLRTLGGSESGFKDSVMGFGGAEWSLFFRAQSDTPPKLAAFVYAFEHLKIGGYELLKRTAERAGDGETAGLCERMLDRERRAVSALAATFGSAASAWREG